jgi:hypothetical protein
MNMAGTSQGTRHGTRSERVENVRTDTEPIAEAEAEQRLTSSRNDAQTARATERQTTARLAEIHWLDAFTITACTIRPDWNPAAVRGVIARTKGSREVVARRMLRAATNPDVRSPLAIENLDERNYEKTPTPMSWAELRDRETCANGAIHDPYPCALCRAGVGA